jgi:hypothetical protein
MNQAPIHHFKSLLALRLITDEQYQRAATHERLATLTTVESDSDALFRMVICGVVTENDLEHLVGRLAETQGSASHGDSEKLTIVNETLSFINAAIRNLNREPLDVLLGMSLIDAEQHEAGLDIRPSRAEGLMDSPARALAILVNHGIVAEERLAELAAEGLENPLEADAKERRAVAAEAAKAYHGIVGQYVKAMSLGAIRFVGLMMLAVLGVIGLAVWLAR